MNWMKRACALILALMLLLGTARAERLSDQELMKYYQDSVVIGDSIPRMLRNYIVNVQKKDPTFFEGMQFYAYYSFAMRSLAREKPWSNEVNLKRRGTDYTLCQLMAQLKPDKVFLLAGLNDKITDEPERGMGYVEEIMRLMKEYAPETQVYFFSLTPVTNNVQKKRPTLPERLDAYNAMLEAKCEEVGAIYVEIAENLKGENGLLRSEWSNDHEYHLNDEGNAVWVQTLLDFAQSRYDAGLWTPEEGGY